MVNVILSMIGIKFLNEVANYWTVNAQKLISILLINNNVLLYLIILILGIQIKVDVNHVMDNKILLLIRLRIKPIHQLIHQLQPLV